MSTPTEVGESHCSFGSFAESSHSAESRVETLVARCCRGLAEPQNEPGAVAAGRFLWPPPPLRVQSNGKNARFYWVLSRSINSVAANTRRGRPFLRRENERSTTIPASARRTSASCAV